MSKQYIPPDDLRAIPGFPGYFISPRGEVWCNRPTSGSSTRMKPKKLVILKVGKGYYSVCLSINSRRFCRMVHRLVLETFVGPRPAGMQCRHLNGNSLDNRVENLAWGTRHENADDAKRHGTRCFGENHGQAKLTEGDVRDIRKRFDAGEWWLRIAKEYEARIGITRAPIYNVCYRRTWKHLP